MCKIRLVVKVPTNCQTGPDSWQDTTSYRTFDVEVPDELYKLMDDDNGHWPATVVGAERIDEGAV